MPEDSGDTGSASSAALGAFIKEQRRLANLSIRRLADLAQISNPYLSQLERGLHEPSVRILNSLAQALDLSAEVLLDQAGLLRDIRDGDLAGESPEGADSSEAGSDKGARHGAKEDLPSTEAAIRVDERLSAAQKRALIAVYRSYVSGTPTPEGG